MFNIRLLFRFILNLFLTVALAFVLISCGEEEKQVVPEKPEVKDTLEITDTVEVKKEVVQQLETAKKFGIPKIYEVQDGESLVSIAEKFYNDRLYWFKIFALNEYQIDDWNKIYPGQKLNLPQSEI